MLLVILVGMLLFAVLFYKYIPSKKIIEPVQNYVASEEVRELLSDNITEEQNEVVYTYEVTASDLTRYEKNKDYVPGKSNPFATLSEEVDPGTTENNNSGSSINSGTSNNSSTGTNTSPYAGTADKNQHGLK